MPNVSSNTQLQAGLANHLRKTICSSFVNDIYEEVKTYPQGVSKSCALRGLIPEKFLGNKIIEISASGLLTQGSWDNVVKLITKEVFRDLEHSDRINKNIIKLLAKRLGLQLDSSVIEEAQLFFEIRHLLVHSGGIADHSFISIFPDIKLDPRTREIVLTFRLLSNPTNKFNKLDKEIDEQIITKN